MTDAPAKRPFLHIHPTFFVMAVLLSATRGATALSVGIWCGVVLVSVIVHELGHAGIARAFGYRPWIELHGMGGTTFFEGIGTATTGRRVAVSLAGPMAGFLLGGLVLAVRPVLYAGLPPTAAGLLVGDAIWVNFGWGIFNLLPIAGFDGGHVVEALIRKAAPKRGAVISRWVGVGAGVVVGGALLYLGYQWAAMMVAIFSLGGFRNSTRAADPTAGARVEPGEPVETVEASTEIDRAKLAVGAARSVDERTAAAKWLARAYLAANDPRRAQVVIDTMLDGVAPG